jgi:hypothetical protein
MAFVLEPLNLPGRLAGSHFLPHVPWVGVLARRKGPGPRASFLRQNVLCNAGTPGVETMSQSEASDAVLRPGPTLTLQGLDSSAVQDILTIKGITRFFL